MKCVIRWEKQGEWRGPFEVHAYGDGWAKLKYQGEYYPTIPRAWTLGLADGWTIWEGGECPVDGGGIIDVTLRNGRIYFGHQAVLSIWAHDDTQTDIVAYRVVEEAPKTLDQDEDKPSLSEILDRTLWWMDDTNVWRSVDSWDTEAGRKQFRLSEPGYNTYVSRDWFTGRLHLTADELAEEMEG